MRHLLTTIAGVLLSATLASAQPPTRDFNAQRYELGQHLKRFELEWDKETNEDGRKRALVPVQKITQQFFSFQFGEAARSLDLATFLLKTDIEPAVSRQWAWSLFAVPESRVIDGSATELAVTIDLFYPIKGDIPKGLEIQLWFTDKQITTIKPEKFPVTAKVPLPKLGEFRGLDRKLYFMVESGKEIRRTAIGISQIADAKTRIAAIKKTASERKTIETLEQATVRDRAELLTDLLTGTVPETDLPAADLLANAETMLDNKPFFTPAKHGQFWLSIPTDAKKTTPARVFIPKGLDAKKPVPVVLALHGAGGSENLFFEGYGAGRIVQECEKRGWVLVATRSGLNFGSAPPAIAVLDQLAKRYPIDLKRTFVVGHSMGAAQTIDLIQKNPERFTAAAALGGAGTVRDAKTLAGLPIFIGVGDKDFALAGARGLNKSLTAGGAKMVTFKEYAGIEHMVIVREALPDVFALFDERAKEKP